MRKTFFLLFLLRFQPLVQWFWFCGCGRRCGYGGYGVGVGGDGVSVGGDGDD